MKSTDPTNPNFSLVAVRAKRKQSWRNLIARASDSELLDMIDWPDTGLEPTALVYAAIAYRRFPA